MEENRASAPPGAPFEKHYKAFISYAHADNRALHRKWADWLHHALETYQVPAELVGQPNQHGAVVPERIYPVFQDEKELSANASLSASLNSALDRSEFLVFLSSPRSARSVYVQEEIRHFKRTGRGGRIVTLIVRGEPEYGEQQSENQCFPEVLRFAVDESGAIDFSRHDEALAADARLPDGAEGYTSQLAYREALQRGGMPARQARQKAAEYGQRLHLAKLKIVATILGVPLAELTRRDQAYQLEQIRRKNRAIQKVAAAMAALALLAGAAGFLAWQQKNAAQRHLAQSLYVSGINKLAQGEYGEPAAYIAAAVRAGSRPAAQLAQSMLAARQDMTLLPNMSAALAAFSPDGRFVAGFAHKGDGQFGLQIWDAATRTLREEVPALASQNPARPLFDAQGRVYVRSDAGMARYDLQGRKAEVLLAGEQSLMAVGSDGRFLILRDAAAQQLQWLDTHAGAQGAIPVLRDVPGTQAAGAVFSDDGRRALLWSQADAQTLTGKLIGWENAGQQSGESNEKTGEKTNEKTGEKTSEIAFAVQADIPQRLRFSADGRHVLLLSGRGLWRIDAASGAVQAVGAQAVAYRWADFNADGSVLAVHAQGYEVYAPDGQRLASQPLAAGQLIAALEESSERSPDQLQRFITLNKQLYLGASAHDNLLIAQAHFPADVRQVLADAEGRHFLALSADGLRIARVDAQSHARQDDFITLPEEATYLRTVGEQALMVVDRERTVRFYRADDGRPIGQAVPTRSRAISISADHTRFLARTGDDGFGIWRIADGQSVVQYRHPHTLDKFTTDDDFRYLLTAGAAQWQLIDIASGQVVLRVDEALSNAAFSPDSRLLAVAKSSGQSDVYALGTRQKIFSLPTVAAPLLRFSPDGQVLLAAQDTKRLRLWHTASGRAYGAALSVAAEPQLLQFSEDGRRHTIVVGAGDKGRALLQSALAQTGQTAVVIERQADAKNLAAIRRAGHVALIGNASDEATLLAAGAQHARRLICFSSDEARGIEVAARLSALYAQRRLSNRLQCHIHLDNPRLVEIFQRNHLAAAQGDAGLQIRFFNAHTLLARRFFHQLAYPLAAQLQTQLQTQQHNQTEPLAIHLVGYGDTAAALLLQGLRVLHLLPGQSVLWHIHTPGARQHERTFAAQYPQAQRIAPIHFHEHDGVLAPEHLQHSRWRHLVLCVSPDNARSGGNLDMAAEILNATAQADFPVYVCGSSRSIAPLLGGSAAQRLHFFGDESEVCHYELITGERQDRLAQAIHADYLAGLGEQSAASESAAYQAAWEALGEDAKTANRAQADHIVYKLALTGQSPQQLPQFTDAQIEALAHSEHRRWAAHRYLGGWQYGSARDDARKLHPSLLDWEALSEAEKNKDRDTVRRIAHLLRTIGLENL